MKSTIKNLAALFLVGIFTMSGITASAIEKTKEYHESWAASSVQTLEIINKFGEVKVNNEGGSNVTIDVEVTVEAANEGTANELLGQINVSFSKSGNTVKAETSIDKDFKGRMKFTIDYTVNIPADKNLNISNKYGNTVVNELNASGNFDIQYGNFTANKLHAPEDGEMNLNLEYGKADISNASDMKAVVKYSTVNLGEMEDLNLESKYNVVSIDKAGVVTTDSKYDTFNFEELESLSGTTKYSHIKIGTLSKSLKIEAGYGGVKVEKVVPGFESIFVTNSYGQVSLGLNDTSYSLDASCEYCGIKYPEDEFDGNRMKENTSISLQGKVGSGGGGTVTVKSKYGEIKLQN